MTYVFSENREKYIGLAEASGGIGLMVGPIMGGFLYFAFGYFVTFMIFCGMVLIGLLTTIFLTPNYLNENEEEDENDQ